MLIRKFQAFALIALGALAVPFAMAADQNQQVGGHAVVTVDPGKETPGNIPQSALHLKLNGKESEVTGFTPLREPQSKVELVVLVDDAARGSLGTQMKDIANFIQGQMPGTKVGVAYMLNGRAVFSQPLTTDLAAAAHGVHLPMAGEGASSSPYFCLSDLAKNWPSNDPHARREVVMISDGVDNYEPRYDPEDPYVQAAMNDAVRAHLIVYTIYWRSRGRLGGSNYGAYDGQNLLTEVAGATGGKSYWEGLGNPVSFDPYFKDIDQRIDNQFELDFMTVGSSKPAIDSLKLTVSARAKLDAPGEVYVHPGAE